MATLAHPEISIPAEGVTLHGDLVIPPGATGLAVFAHGSGSSRHSPRNRFVAEELQKENIGTLLVDLLSEREEAIDARSGHLRFDISLLADRLAEITEWVAEKDETTEMSIGYFGASTGAAAALMA